VPILHQRSTPLALVFVLTVVAGIVLAAQAQPPVQQPDQERAGRQSQPPGGGRRGAASRRLPRDAAATTGTGVLSGKVVAADTGRAVKRARVVVTGGGRPRAATTDEQGRFRIDALPAGTYSISATKTGFVDGAFGQRRSLGTGTLIELADGQQRADVDLKLLRGGVVTGRLFDEDGEPLARAMVTVLRQQYVRGEKQLTPVGADQSDDRGQFRIFGLPPGDYYVSAMAGGVEQIMRQMAGPGRRGPDQAPESSGYAATYYPGVISAGDAARVKLAASQELSGIDFQLQIVPLATVKGVVVGSPGTVMLVPDEGSPGGRGRGAGAGGLRSATRQDGSFSIPNVTPGQYTIIARADGGPSGGGLRTAVQPLAVAGEEVHVVLTPAAGVGLSGSITFESAGTPLPTSFGSFRVDLLPLGSAMTIRRMARPDGATGSVDAATSRARAVRAGGEFSIPDVMAGHYVIRAAGPRGWMMKAVYVDGREVTDQPIEVRSDNLSGIRVVFSDRISALSGTVRDGRGNGATGLTVILFPDNPRLWRPQSRQIVTARTEASGAYRIAAIPAGDYLAAAVDDVEQGEWFDPAFLERLRERATTLKIGEGEERTMDLKAPSPSQQDPQPLSSS
jgi:hypothetical protein